MTDVLLKGRLHVNLRGTFALKTRWEKFWQRLEGTFIHL
jgi:hypothetical protein